MPDSAREYAHRILAISSQPARVGLAAYVLARNGDRSGAEALVRQLEATPATAWPRWTGLALAYTGLSDFARTVSALEHASAGDGGSFPQYGMRINELPSSPRLDAVWRRYNLDPARFASRSAMAH